jgi:hypothetical protein
MSGASGTNTQSASSLHFDEHLSREHALTVHFTVWQTAEPDAECIARILRDILEHAWTCLGQKGSLDTMSSACPWLVEVINEPDYEEKITPLEVSAPLSSSELS